MTHSFRNPIRLRRASWLVVFAALSSFGATAQERVVIKADRIFTAAGDVIEGGSITIVDGKIASVGVGGGSGEVIEVAAVTPGMVDLAAAIDMRHYGVEQSTEASIELEVSSGVDFFSYRWDRVLRDGVTTALAAPFDMNVFGGLCVALKTGGEPTLEAREIASNVALRASIGTQPSTGNYPPRGRPPIDFYARRPTTRMGVEWLFRSSYYDALNAERFDLEVDSEQARRNEILLKTITGELLLIVKAPATQDVRTAIYLKEEFGIRHMILDNAIEAWKEPELMRRSGVGVILPPFPRNGRVRDPFANDSYFQTLDCAAKLTELGVLVALSGHGSKNPEARLSSQAGFAMRGGMSFDDALAAVTINPARMIGVDDRVGSIEVGKDANLVLWNGTPFEPSSGIIAVILDGKLAFDLRPRTEGN